MGSFIVKRRIETAQTLLATTDLQIKRVAFHTGHANPSWFCHLFRAHTGAAPAKYRARMRRSSA